MSDLHVLPNIPIPASPDYYSLYLQAYCRELASVVSLEASAGKLALYGVRMLRHENPPETKSLEWLTNQFDSYQCVMAWLGLLTPKRFLEIFPVPKEYHGTRYGMKDYFSVMDALKEYDFNAPIGTPVTGFLWDCLNIEIGDFLAEMLCIMGDIRRLNGEKDMFEEFFGIPVYYEHTDPVTGQKYMQNNETGETFPVKKTIPRYLRPVQTEE